MKKKIITMLLCLAIGCTFVSCGSENSTETGSADEKKNDITETTQDLNEKSPSEDTDSKVYTHKTKHPPENAPENACGDNLTWRIEGDTLYIEGSGEMWDFEKHTEYEYDGSAEIAHHSYSIPWYDEDTVKKIKNLDLTEKLTSVGDYAFYNFESLDSIDIPESVEYIGNRAFCGCSSVKSIVIPEKALTIGAYAFSSCESLETIQLPEKITVISEEMLSHCSSLESLELPSGMKKIGKNAFSYSGLKNINLPVGLTTLDIGALSETKLENVIIPGSVTFMDEWIFDCCNSLKTVEFASGITEIGSLVVTNCENIESVKIPKTVTHIAEYAFGNAGEVGVYYYEGSESDWEKVSVEQSLRDVVIHYNSK